LGDVSLIFTTYTPREPVSLSDFMLKKYQNTEEKLGTDRFVFFGDLGPMVSYEFHMMVSYGNKP